MLPHKNIATQKHLNNLIKKNGHLFLFIKQARSSIQNGEKDLMTETIVYHIIDL